MSWIAGANARLSFQEQEFLSEEEIVEVVPNFSMPVLHLMKGDFGPFRAGLPLRIPLWLAVVLREKTKCQFLTPEWMTVGALEKYLELENRGEHTFSMLPQHYLSISTQIFACASEDIEDLFAVKRLLTEITSRRSQKMRSGARSFQGSTAAMQVNNITPLELNGLHTYLSETMTSLDRIGREAPPPGSFGASQSSSQFFSQAPSVVAAAAAAASNFTPIRPEPSAPIEEDEDESIAGVGLRMPGRLYTASSPSIPRGYESDDEKIGRKRKSP